eukprot:CAMPEP_0194159580 /NCGR_PEP_ID=MMETSP0152-20130528/77914_1 /TAXON_ID=1049557 /ORGANISM="Thalassiothrix antarctica, Strain L6-D1" /LENGTH=53 /DNA_ID=CAMNT_0038869171 /DNA_START=147 /DNA_END=308 /DNA_ORIENTATION=-
MIFIHTVPEMSSMQQEDEIERALSSSSDEEWDETLVLHFLLVVLQLSKVMLRL